MTERKLDQWANSATLNVIVKLVSLIVLPMLVWIGGKTIDRLEKLETATAINTVTTATFELRIRALEAGGMERGAAIRALQDAAAKHELAIELLKVRQGVVAAK